tara:strand:- start:367 stop:675 length:309 start_codon:yes stop_codon:yes gene_type:complete
MTIETKVTFGSADLKALGNPLHDVGASFDGEISWDYDADEDGLHGLHWYAYKLHYLIGANEWGAAEWIPIDADKRSIDILGDQVAELYDQARDHLQELAGDL